MWNRKTVVSGLVVAGVAFLGACSDQPPTEPRSVDGAVPALFGGPVQNPQDFDGTLDAYFVRIAQAIPGFGGYYYDESGTLHVVMAPTAQPLSRGEVQSRLAAHLEAIRQDPAAARNAVLREGQYDFAQLDAMHRQASNVLGLPGTVFTDADEVRNRVVIGVENAAAAAAVERAVAMLGLPAEAVIIEHARPVYPEQTLRSQVRPVAGGLQISFPAGICTHGFNVRPASPAGQHIHGFVTNSHCSNVRGEVTGTSYWQPSAGVPNSFIGNEEHDIPFFTGGICPPGRLCRWSDSLGARYAPGVENAVGAIYRTLFAGEGNQPPDRTGSLEIDPANPRWQIVDELPFPVVGMTVNKTGRTNGWTRGPVTVTCQHTNVGASELTMLCQDRIFTWSAGGDSGSPYYERIGDTNNVRLTGLHWGSDGMGNTVMSAMSNIRFENIHPQGWITFPGQTPPPAAPR